MDVENNIKTFLQRHVLIFSKREVSENFEMLSHEGSSKKCKYF